MGTGGAAPGIVVVVIFGVLCVEEGYLGSWQTDLTKAGGFVSYCWTVLLGPNVKSMAPGPKLQIPLIPSVVGMGSYATCFVLTSQAQVSLPKISSSITRAS